MQEDTGGVEYIGKALSWIIQSICAAAWYGFRCMRVTLLSH